MVADTLITFGVFLVLYFAIRERARRRAGTAPPMNWRGLGLILLFAAIAVLIGVVQKH